MGKLEIRIVEARGLPDTERFGAPDMYCSVECEGNKFKTEVDDSHGTSPQWGTVIKFMIADENSAQLHFKIYNENTLGDDLLGEYRLNCNGIVKGEVSDEWYLLQNCKANAELRVRMKSDDFGAEI